MPRADRICFPGAVYHIIQRGNNKQNIFVDDTESLINMSYFDWDMAYLSQILWAMSHGKFYSSLFGLNFL